MPEIKYNFVKLDELINKPIESTCGRSLLVPLSSITLK